MELVEKGYLEWPKAVGVPLVGDRDTYTITDKARKELIDHANVQQVRETTKDAECPHRARRISIGGGGPSQQDSDLRGGSFHTRDASPPSFGWGERDSVQSAVSQCGSVAKRALHREHLPDAGRQEREPDEDVGEGTQ